MKAFPFCVLVLLSITAAAQADDVALRVRFGLKDKEGQDWNGKLDLSEGAVKSMRGWHWMPGDHASGNEFTVATRRGAAQSAAERARVQAGNKLPVRDNGFEATHQLRFATDGRTSLMLQQSPGKDLTGPTTIWRAR